ncbi:MAG: phosphonate ABC transporter, permease protein PhnE [Acidobacteria bacterium]|nr:phosphonate ABC transporter, permease protein PhnE [Acidobacteriota bacterium]
MPADAWTIGQRVEANAPRRVALALALAGALAICWRAAEVHPLALFEASALASVWHFVCGMFPPDLSPDFLRVVASAIGQTLAIAIAGTALSILVGLPLGILSATTPRRGGVLLEGDNWGTGARAMAAASHLARAMLGFMRAVPDLVWGLLFVVAVGLGSLAGTLGLAVAYGGMLGRVYADVFEDVDPQPVEALRACGATRAQVFLRAVWPQAAPSITTYTLYSLECSVRAASVLGFVGAGGIGYEINLSMRMFEHGQVLTLILALVALLTANDALSRFLRRRLHATCAAQNSFARRLTGRFVRRVVGRASGVLSRPLGHALSRAALPVAMALAVGFSFYVVGLTRGALFDAGVVERVARFAGKMFPPELDSTFLSSLATPLLQTLGISVIGTLIGIAIGAALALPGTSTLMLVEPDAAGRRTPAERAARRVVYQSARLFFTLLRSIPELVWVLIFILAVGLGPFAGTLAIGLHTGGVLGKLYAETLEEVPKEPIEALRASGASPIQILVWGAWPQARPMLTSYTVLRWEMNLRVSTVLGLVGGGGLGQAIYNNVQLGFYARLATLILVVYALVMMTDWLGDRLRRRSFGTRLAAR